MIINREFLGVGWRFPLQVTPSGRIAQSKYEDVHKRIRGEMDRLAIRFRESELTTSPGTIIGTTCYNSPEYTEARQYATGNAVRHMVAVEGLD